MKNLYKYSFLIIVFIADNVLSQFRYFEPNPDTINIGFSKDMFQQVDIRDATVAIKMWGDQLLSKNDLVLGETKIYSNAKEIIESLENNEVDLISLSVIKFLDIENKTEIEPRLTTITDNKSGHEILLLVKKNSNFNKLESLQNKKIIILNSKEGEISKIWLTVELNKINKRFDNFFSKISFTNKPSKALFPVFFNQADACLITKQSFLNMAELNPQIKNDLKILKTSPIYPMGLMCFNNNKSEEFKKKIINTAVGIDKSSAGNQILTIFKAGTAVLYDEKMFVNIRKLYKEYLKLNKN